MDLDTLLFISWLWFVHWIANFVCQTDEMALNKSSSNYWLTCHVITYSLILCFGCLLCSGPTMVQLGRFTIFILSNSLLHWITDWATSRLTSHLWKHGDRHNFFVVIGLDQLIHFSTLTLTAYLIL